jgi:thiamine biosynthesis lipoprotein
MEPRRFAFRAMGSPCELRLYDSPGSDTDAVAEAARAEVERLERKYSRYREESLASRINRSAGDPRGVEVDEETAHLLDYAQIAYEQSEGLFDITSGILRRAWNLEAGRVPRQEEIDALLDFVGWEKLCWEPPRLVLPKAGMELDFGGYVKEYASDRVSELCRRRGLRHGLVDLGGDLGIVGPHPDGRPWHVGVRNPFRSDLALATLSLGSGAIASSGDYERCMIVGGRRYGHILDPRTGWPVEGLASVSVVASHCLVAGTASTIAMLKGPGEAVGWLEALGLPHLRVTRSGEIGGSLTRRVCAAA